MQLELSKEDRDLLIRILDRTLGEMRSEVRRTREPEYHDRLVSDEERVKALLEELRERAR